MEALEVMAPAFWSARSARVLAPPRLAEEGSEVSRLLGETEAIVFASSGSGGAPKWIRLTRGALLASAEAVNRHLEVGPADRWMLALPVFHVGGFGVAARAYVAGCGFKRFAGKWNAMRFAEELAESGASLTSLVPTQVHDLVACGLRAPDRLRAVVVGGARLDEIEGEAARELGWPLLQSYGMTETASQVATAPLSSLDGEFRAAPLPILPLWEYRLGTEGCLHLRGAALCAGYLIARDGRLLESDPRDAAGWFATTDRAALEDGGVTVLGRADRQVKILGELVDVEAIEAELRGHLPAGAEVHVLHLPDERRGWRLLPVISGAASGAEDLLAFLNSRLPGFARLDLPHYVESMPRTPLGKIDGTRLHEELARRGR